MASTNDIIAATLANNKANTGSIKLFGYDFTGEQLLQLAQFTGMEIDPGINLMSKLSQLRNRLRDKYDSISAIELQELFTNKLLDRSDIQDLAHMYYLTDKHDYLRVVLQHYSHVWVDVSKSWFANNLTIEQLALRQLELGKNVLSFIELLEFRGRGIDRSLAALMREKNSINGKFGVRAANIFSTTDHRNVDSLQLAALRYLELSLIEEIPTTLDKPITSIGFEPFCVYTYSILHRLAVAGNVTGVKYCLKGYPNLLDRQALYRMYNEISKALVDAPQRSEYMEILGLISAHQKAGK